MLKAMVFIDGSWFGKALEQQHQKRRCVAKYANQLDFAPVWRAIRAHIHDQVSFEVDLVRAYFIAAHPDPETVAPETRDQAIRLVKYQEELSTKPLIDLEAYSFDYRRKPFGQADGDAHEKCVDVAVATKMLYFAAVPSAYDVAVLISGDRDFVPVVRAVRNLGKRTLLATFINLDRCARELTQPSARGDLWDFNVLPLDQLELNVAGATSAAAAT